MKLIFILIYWWIDKSFFYFLLALLDSSDFYGPFDTLKFIQSKDFFLLVYLIIVQITSIVKCLKLNRNHFYGKGNFGRKANVILKNPEKSFFITNFLSFLSQSMEICWRLCWLRHCISKDTFIRFLDDWIGWTNLIWSFYETKVFDLLTI